jgi:hypothetical protein
MRKKLLALAPAMGILACACATAASAGTLNCTGYGFVGDNIQINTQESVYRGAGEIRLTTTSGTADAWCVDVFTYRLGSGAYDVGPMTGGLAGVPSGLTSAQIGELGALVVNGDYLVAHPGGYGASDVAAAIQVAIWSVEYGAAFTYNPISSAVAGLTAQYLADATNGAWAPYSGIEALFVPGNQGFATNQTLKAAGVPESSTWAMLLVGFVGLGYAARRRHTKPRLQGWRDRPRDASN